MKTYHGVFLRVHSSDGKEAQKFTLRPERGMVFDRDGILLVVSNFIWQLKEAFPGNEFKAIKVRPNKYDIVPQPLGRG